MDLSILHCEETSEYFVLRARANLKIVDVSKAFDDILKALEINPGNKEALEIKKFLCQN